MFAAAIVASVIMSGAVSADPSAPPGLRYRSVTDALLFTFIFNLPVNLLWFSIALYGMCRAFGCRVGAVPRDPRRFFGSIMIAMVVVTALGSIIDFALLSGEGWDYFLNFDATNWAAAAALIFVSIYFSSLLFLNLDTLQGLIPASVITALNPIWWWLAKTQDASVATWTLVCSLLLLPLFFMLLWKWHGTSFPRPSPA
jgi:hypothetical protein